MSQYRKILVAVSPAMQRTPAFDRAVSLARSTGASLHLCIVDHLVAVDAVAMIHRDVADLARRSFIAERLDWLREQCHHLRGQDVRATASFEWGTADHGLPALAAREACDLIVRDTGSRALDRRVLRNCHVPLLLVRRDARPVRRVAAAVACTGEAMAATSRQVVDAALGLAIQCDAACFLVSVFEGLPPAAPASNLMSDPVFAVVWEEARRQTQARFDALQLARGIDPGQGYFLSGEPAGTVSNFAVDHGIDVLVIGASHRHGLERMALGSTAEQVAECCPCDVLVVPARAEVADPAWIQGNRSSRAGLPGALAPPA